MNINLRISEKQLQEINEIARLFDLESRTATIRFLISIGVKYQKGLLKEVENR